MRIQYPNYGKQLGWMVAALCVGAVLPLSGCVAIAAAGAGAGSVAAVNAGILSDYHAYYPRPLGTVQAAVLQVFSEMHITYVGNVKKNPDKWIIDGKTAAGTAVNVILKSTSPGVTKVTMGVGLFGNKTLSRQFFSLLNQKLGVQATVKAPSI
ncbi:DUF3568 family protein [Acidithiobacillus thiooxidans]|uniref:Lipoprotein n=1 Tax=Acidithiobacillus thiooxidans ATCC 19377 TaxID=637390 RepID=A0A543PZ79_ACITH|nr:DUF3568 family protein [Acidithiobacillus thiooxidans]TQN49351.1 hypothetical protein DLNHIDIE_03399 [Acidithiobacillus thiooxidans ATCC 19377]